MKQSILVLAAHPDDEVLGCGGTIAKLADEGVIVHIAFLADGVFSENYFGRIFKIEVIHGQFEIIWLYLVAVLKIKLF